MSREAWGDEGDIWTDDGYVPEEYYLESEQALREATILLGKVLYKKHHDFQLRMKIEAWLEDNVPKNANETWEEALTNMMEEESDDER